MADAQFSTERKWRWFGRIMLAVMALVLLVITLMGG
ncbi:hypothetical protein EDC22_104172 [Tepidamorphus gemmatus]|uniref:Uncharacterized protein n=1 Tax=Tepidamorphus gemmatus TaxID=747076 RepID=A0A4R3MEH8_9HYPH|nr:hypothetical protein EDC22_104172 [Tepidamorphus gemmatus]